MDGQTTINQFEDPLRYRDGSLPDPPAALVPYAPHALRSAKIDEIQTRSDLMRELLRHIPINEYGLPSYIYRSDLLDVGMITGSMKRGEAQFVDEMLQTAIIQIWYTQGFPTTKDETPLWGQLNHEPKDAYDAFLMYCEQEGVRGVHLVTAVPPELAREWYHQFFWAARARALDIFKAAHHARLREHRIMDLEDSHWIDGQKIYDKLVRALNGKSDDEIKELDVDKLVATLERVTKIQRGSVGLGSQPSVKGSEVPKATSVEVTLKQAANHEAQPIESDEFDASLLSDPEMLRQAQELIIKVNR